MRIAKAKDLLPDFEKWESSYASLQTENEALKNELEEALHRLQEQNKLLSIKETLTDSLTQKSRESRRAQEEVRLMKAKEDVSKQQWESLRKTTEDQLNLIINLLMEQSRPNGPQRNEVEKA